MNVINLDWEFLAKTLTSSFENEDVLSEIVDFEKRIYNSTVLKDQIFIEFLPTFTKNFPVIVVAYISFYYESKECPYIAFSKKNSTLYISYGKDINDFCEKKDFFYKDPSLNISLSNLPDINLEKTIIQIIKENFFV